MSPVRFAISFSVAVLSAVAVSTLSGQQPPTRASGPIAIVGARLIDGTGGAPLDDSVVIVEGDRIRSAGPRARVVMPNGVESVDARGKVLLPGLVDVHCHINQPPEDMKRYWIAQLRWGVTTMRSAGNDKPETVPLFRQTRSEAFPSPRAYTAGQGFNVSGPYPGAPTFKPTTPDEARANVRNLKSQQVDFIKIWMTNPMFPPEVIAAIVDEGKKQGIPVTSHVTDVASLHQLADLGVTDFLHNPIDRPVNPELIAYAKAKKLTFAPTLANIESRWFYYEHPDILQMPMLQDALYPRGRQMLADAEGADPVGCGFRAAQGADARTDLSLHQGDVRRRCAGGDRNRLRRRSVAGHPVRPRDAPRNPDVRRGGHGAARRDPRGDARCGASAHPVGGSGVRGDSCRQGRGSAAAGRGSHSRHQQHDQNQ
jgi:Amidohydrolase family